MDFIQFKFIDSEYRIVEQTGLHKNKRNKIKINYKSKQNRVFH